MDGSRQVCTSVLKDSIVDRPNENNVLVAWFGVCDVEAASPLR